jgi:hypothetical protein
MRAPRWKLWRLSKSTVSVAVAAAALGAAYAASPPMLQGTLRSVVSTVKHGDVNPYGMAFVGKSSGRLVSGDVLVSNALIFATLYSLEMLPAATGAWALDHWIERKIRWWHTIAEPGGLQRSQ